MTENKEEYVYVVQMGDDGPIKIGKSRAFRQRLCSLNVGSPVPIKVRALIKGGHKLEQKLHEKFADSRLRGEWFEPSEFVMMTIADMDSENISGYEARESKGPRAKKQTVKSIWYDTSLTTHQAIEKMPGWAIKAAISELGPRGKYEGEPSEHKRAKAKAMANARWSKRKYKGTVQEWKENPELAEQREAMRNIWTSTKYANATEAYNALPEEVREQITSLDMARKIFGKRLLDRKFGRPKKTDDT